MSNATPKPIDADAKVRLLESNRRNLGRELGKYQSGRAHHVLELQLLYDGSGGTKILRQDPVARLLFYAQQNGLFDINGLQNTLMLPDTVDLARTLGTSVHDNGPHVNSYNEAIRKRIADTLKDDLALLGNETRFNEFLQTGKISGKTTAEITEINARINTQLDRVATEFSRSLGGKRPALSAFATAGKFIEGLAGYGFINERDPYLIEAAAKFGVTPRSLLDGVNAGLAGSLTTTKVTAAVDAYERLGDLRNYGEIDLTNPALKAKDGRQYLEALIDTVQSLKGTPQQERIAAMLLAAGEDARVPTKAVTIGGRVLRVLDVAAFMADPQRIGFEWLTEAAAKAGLVKAGVGTLAAGTIASYALFAFDSTAWAHGVATGRLGLANPFTNFLNGGNPIYGYDYYTGSGPTIDVTAAIINGKAFGNTPEWYAGSADAQLRDGDVILFGKWTGFDGSYFDTSSAGVDFARGTTRGAAFSREGKPAAIIVPWDKVKNRPAGIADHPEGIRPSDVFTMEGDVLVHEVWDPATGKLLSTIDHHVPDPARIKEIIEHAEDYRPSRDGKPDARSIGRALDDGVIVAVERSGALGAGLASAITGALPIKDPFAKVAASAALATIGENLFEAIANHGIATILPSGETYDVLANAASELGINLLSAGVGSVSSYLIGELVNAIGIHGTLGDIANTLAGSTLGQIASNLAQMAVGTQGVTAFSGINPASVGAAIGSYLGNKLAAKVISFDTVGGQIGAGIGSAGAVLLASVLAGGPIGLVPAAAIAFLGNIIGGLIGSVFGGTPRSGADVIWDDGSKAFSVANAYARKGGSKEAAVRIATSVSATFNAILDATGGALLNPSAVQAGNYGMRKRNYVYRPVSTRDEDAITQRFSGKDAASKLINHGIQQALSGPAFALAGGDILAKRALYNSLDLNRTNFSIEAVMGDLQVARDYGRYRDGARSLNTAIAIDPESGLSIGWAVTLARAQELGLNKRHWSDWTGGWSYLLPKAELIASVSIGLDDGSRYIDIVNEMGGVLQSIGDTIDTREQTRIQGTDANDVISLSSGAIINRNGLVVDNIESDGRTVLIAVAATVDGGDGNDTIHASDLGDNLFGGAGDDALYGGRLDDWLLGGDGGDTLDAGSADRFALGGDGNYLDGGAGNDTLRGREGSDWLEGGDGVDILTGGAGDDILAGGAGDADNLKGGIGSDQYIVRRGDGIDVAEEDATGAPVASGAGDAITQRIARIEQWKVNAATVGAIRPDWVGTSAGVQTGSVAGGGDDAVVFGDGIDIGDIKLRRSGTGTTPGNDLIIQVMTTASGVETFSGTQLTIRDWFTNPFKRVEWLRFADGNEIRIGDITSFVVGGSGNDVLVGTAGNDFVYGGPGDDKLFLLAGDDVGNGGTGNDLVMGDAGRDLVIGGLGNDDLVGGAGADAITGDSGADDIYGGGDRDTLSGGRGDGDMIVGGAGDDTFRYARGDGRDMMFDEFANYWAVVWTQAGAWNTAAGFAYNNTTGEVSGPGGVVIRKNFGTGAAPDFQWLGRYDYDSVSQTLKFFNPPANATTITANAGVDTIEFAPGINLQDVILRKPSGSNDLVMAVSSEDEELGDTAQAKDSITIKDWYLAPGQIEKLAFYQTGILDIAPAKMTLIAGTDGADGTMVAPLQGTAVADWITGAAGDDVIAGGNGNDILAGNSGFDTLKGEAGNDVLYGGAGNDILDGGAGGDILIGGSGQDIASYMSASQGVRAYLSAAFANYRDSEGDEYTSIEGLIGSATGDRLGGDAGQNDLTGGQGSDYLFGGTGEDTYIWSVGDGADTIRDAAFTVDEAVGVDGTLKAGYVVSIWAATGSVDAGSGNKYWRLQIKGPDGSVVYDNSNFSYASNITPAVPAPPAYAQAGWLGGFARTNGQQVIRERFDDGLDGGSDILEFGANISLGDLTFIKSSNNLIVRYGESSASQITLVNHALANSQIETLQFADGLSLSLASIVLATSNAQQIGTINDDLMAGRSGALADNLAGGEGNDVLVGYAGDDLLEGGNGDDVFEGGLGADRLDGGSNSLSSSGPGAGDTARYVRSTAAVSVNLTLATAQGGATGADSVGDILIGIENVTGSAFDDTLTGDANDNRLFGLDGADTIRGGAGADVLVGDGGNDMLYGDVDEDNIAGGDGNDTIYGGTEKDVLDGGEGADTIYGEAGNDRLTGGAGGDILDGGGDDDVLSGGSENDQLIGGLGNDTLSGGLGDDTLGGGIGNDIYALERFSGADTLTDTDGTNSITFDASVAYDKVWLTRVGNDLRLAVIGGDTVTTVARFFLATGQTRIRSIETTTHTIFLDNPDTLALVTAMTAATAAPAVTPTEMPAAVTPLLATYWHAGGKAAPTGPTTPRAVTVAEDGGVALNGSYGVIDHDASVITYSLKTGGEPTKGTISGFNAATGALTYTPFADANGADSFIVVATDADKQSVELPVAVTITAVNDAPRNLAVSGGAALTILESAPRSTTTNGSVVGQFTALDVEGDAITYTLADNAGGRFSISATGELRVLSAALLNREVAASHIIQVKATDSLGAALTTPFVVTVGNVNEAPNTPVLSTSRGIAAEFVAGVNSSNVSTLVQQFTTSDPDGAPAPTLAFVADATGNPGSRFKTVGNQVQFALEPDFEALVGAGFTIADSDSDGLGEVTLTGKVNATDGMLTSPAPKTFSVKVEDVNQMQTAITLTGAVASIDERDRLVTGTAQPAVILGTIGVTDPDLTSQNTGKHDFAVYEGAATTVSTRFAVDASNKLALLANQSLDFETDGASITLKVRATDRSASPLSLDQNFTFAIVNKDDVLEGTASADTLTGQQNRDILHGLAGNDTLSGLAGDDQLEGGDGNDTLLGGDGNDTLLGQADNDTLNGDAGNDALWGGDGDDVLKGGAGNDTLNGEAGNDGVRAAGADYWRGFTAVGLAGGDGDDVLNGGDGDDYLDGGLGADQLIGGIGFDGVTYAGSTAAVIVNLGTNAATGGSAQGDTFSSIELVQGSSLGDTLTGSAAGNVIYGGAGNDTIRGGAGEDFMFGGGGADVIDAESGNDYLDGGLGNDTLRGGADNDTYYIGRNYGNDRIQNFDSTGTNFDHITFDGTVLYTDVWFDRVDDAGVVSASGNHLKMTLLGAAGTEGSVTVDNWFTDPGRMLPENYFKIDLISDGNLRAALPVNVDALVTLMADIPQGSRPTTQAQMASLRSGNQNFRNGLEDNWGRLGPPTISDTVAISGVEPLDNGAQTISFAVRAWFQDDQGLGVVIPSSNIDLTLTTAGGYVLSQFVTAISYGTPDAAGNRTVTLTLAQNASTHLLPGGTLPLQLQAQIRGTTRTTLDAGGIALTISPTADTSALTQLAAAGGNAEFYLPIYVAGTSPDTDGSERTDILVSGLPAGYVFTNGWGQAMGTQEGIWWRFTAAQAATLHMYTPVGSGQDALLAVKTQAIDGTSVRDGATQQLRVKVNGAPTSLILRGTGPSAVPRLNEYVADISATDQTRVGVVVPVDPDSLDLNVISADFNLLPKGGWGEERIVSATGPLGGTVSVLETGQIGTGGSEAGGGVYWAEGGAADTTSAYRFTIYFKPENNSDQTLYFGTSGNVQEATNGAANGNPYFWYGRASSLVQDRWYRIEGYVLPEGTAIIGNDVYGGVFDTVTGAKVANTFTYRFGTGGSNTGARFFSYYGAQQGYSAVWYQPVVEKLGYTYSLDDNAGGRFSINAATGLVTAVGSNFDREAAASHNIVARVTDGGGLAQTQTITITVDNVNEAPNAPGGVTSVWFDESGLGANPANSGVTVTTLSLTDPDGTTPSLQFAAGGNPGNWFTIVSNQVRLAAGFNFDFETLRAQGYGIYDWNGDGHLEAHIANVYVVASDGALVSAPTLLQVFISDVNERPNNLVIEAANLFSETLSGDTVHANNAIARFTMADPDGPSPNLVILGGNQNGWFQSASGNHLVFSSTPNFTADWIRANIGAYGQPGLSDYDVDGDGLKEARVATLILASKDASGAVSDPFTYNVLIEDKNETPVWNSNPYSFDVNEGAGWYAYVGQVGGSDIDGSQAELRYVFANWDNYYDSNLGSYATRSPDGRFVLNDTNGYVYVNGSQALDFEGGPRSFTYSTLIYDKYAGTNNASRAGSVTINLQDVNEAHTLRSASRSRAEGAYSQYPIIQDPNTYYDLRSIMLADPENGTINWTFADGSNVSGIWTLEGSTGRLYLTAGSVDYEAVTTRYETQYGYDEYNGYYEYQVPVRDYSLATQNLSIRAFDGRHSSVATFVATITDVNEGPTLGGYTPRYIVRDDQGNGFLGQLYGYDPETGGAAVSYSISLVSSEEQFLSYGGSSDIDNYANPNVSVTWNNGRLSFNNPGDGEWEGGIKNHPIYGGRWSYQLVYRMQVTMADASGVTSMPQPFEIIFLKHAVSRVLPIVLDLDGDGIEMVDLEGSPVNFDMDLDGTADQSGWVGADDGLLVLDRNGNDTIDDGSEISFARDDEGALTDLEGLRAWDSNRNGFLEAGDTDFGRFQIWRDLNQNGISEAGELFSLTALGIESINLTLNLTGNELVSDHNVLFATSEFQRTDGSTGLVGDVSFAFDPADPPAPVAPPVVFDLDNDNAGLVALADSKTRFDMNGDGIADKTGWIEEGDALLALDRNSNGEIDDIGEISFVADKAGAKTDLEGLAAFDTNGDGILTGEDVRFVEFRLWRDGNGDGKTDAGELLSLAEAGVTAISLTGIATGEATTAGQNIVYNTGTYTLSGGTSGRLLDVGLAFKPLSALPEIEFQASAWAGKARNYRLLAGNGTLHATPRHAQGILSADAGQIAPSAILNFGNRSVGMLSTILLDLDGDGLEARRAEKIGAAFDMDADGVADDTGWVSGGDGLLVIDRDEDDAITHASELSFLSEKEDAKSAWEGLSVLDNTKDGKIDKADARFGELKVWTDRNSDGVSQADEIKSLTDMGITEIGLRSTPTSDSAKIGYNVPLSTATFKWSNGVTATIGDGALAFDPSSTKSKAVDTALDATPSELAAAANAARMMQAMSAFGVGGSESALTSASLDRNAGLDWFTAAAA